MEFSELYENIKLSLVLDFFFNIFEAGTLVIAPNGLLQKRILYTGIHNYEKIVCVSIPVAPFKAWKILHL